MSFVLRPHQAHDFQRLRAEVARHRAVMLVAACGYGKGVITTKIIDGTRQRGKNVLFLVRGRDRVADMDERVTKLNIPHGVLVGGRGQERHHAVQIASSDTVYRMQHKPLADLIIIDETHLAMSRTFREVLDFYPLAKIIGLTATPCLGNGRALGKATGGIYDSMICGPPVKQLIADGYLVGSRVMAPPPPADLSGLKKKSTGEFDDQQGAAICDRADIIGDIVEHWKRHSSDRKTAVFGFDQKHAFHIAEQFRAAGVNFAFVCADTPDDERKRIWSQFDDGDVVGVCSVACISVGWDHSICKTLIFASKTASFPLYHQRLGRGSRPHPGFSDFLVLDHTGNLYEHEEKGPYFESDIEWQLNGDAVKPKDDDKAPSIATCKRAVPVPATGVPKSFSGDVHDGYMLCCYSTFRVGPKACPYCGLTLVVEGRKVEVAAGELQEVTADMREKSGKQLAHESKMKARYLELVEIGRMSVRRDGQPYSPKWPDVTFRSQFNRWPMKAWKDEAHAR